MVCHHYPGEFRDGAILWRRFWRLFAEIPSIGAQHVVRQVTATMTGIQGGLGGYEAIEGTFERLNRMSAGLSVESNGARKRTESEWTELETIVKQMPALSEEGRAEALRAIARRKGADNA